MPPRIALVHTTPAAMPPVHAAFRRHYPEAERFDLLESSLLPDLQQAKSFEPAFKRRITELITYCERAGADAVLVTCSSYSPVTDLAASMVAIPVFKADEALVQAAVARGPRIGLLATVPTAPAPAVAQLEDEARRAGKPVAISVRLCAGAYEALMAGDGARHDELVVQGVRAVAPSVDVIALAQYSMARAMPVLPTNLEVEVLSAPDQAVQRIAERFRG
ncbi:MAG: arylsulfatase [Actinobacteria bacterium]|nr:arylsulfatase [Actinomycetota bacterium]